jgi:arylsulfatase
MTDRPNILLIMTDQQRADSMGYVGRYADDTPYLDRLASHGVIFETAYSGSVSCIPARTALMTGLLHHRVPTEPPTGLVREPMGLALREGYWTIAHALRAAGYQTALLGKMHFQPIHADHGFEIAHACEHRPAGYEPTMVDDYQAWLESTGHDDKRFVKPSNPRVFPLNASYHPTSWITGHALDFLRTRDRSRPYFAVVSYAHPHTPYDPPEPYASMYRPEDQEIPTPGFEVNEGFPWPFSHSVHHSNPEGQYVPVRVDGRPEHHVRAVIAAVRALIRQIDDAVAELMSQVDLSNTVVFFLSDHGDYGGHRGLLGKIPWIPFDDLVRVPFFAVGPGIVGGRRVREPVQSFDYVATALEMAGVEPPLDDMDSRSLVRVLEGGDAEAERAIVSSTSEGAPMIRKGRYKDIWHPLADVHLLYDLEADPGETRTLAADPSYRPLLQENARLLSALLDKPVRDLWVRQPPPR